MYRHFFDLGFFNLYKDNRNGTALFYRVEILEEYINPIKIENRLVLYKWDSMKKI